MPSLRSSVVSAAVFALGLGVAFTAVQTPVHAKSAPKAEASASPAPSPTASAEPLDHAITRLEAKLKVDPTDKVSQLELAQDYLQLGRPDLSLALTQKLLQGGTKTADTYYADGYANNMLGHTPQAIADFEQASNLAPTNVQVLAVLTEMYIRQNRFDDAERIAKRAITFNGSDENAHLAYGRVLVAEKKFDAARSEFETAAKLAPKDAAPFNDEAITYIDQTSIALAGDAYDRALGIDPKNSEALLGRARVYANSHDVKNAIATFDRLLAVQTTPADQAAVLDFEANVYAAEKMDSQAQQLYLKAIANYPTAANAHVAYGDYFAQQKNMPQAEAQWTTALGPNRDNADALARLGQLYGQEKQYSKATDQFKRLATVAPTNANAYMALGQLYTIQHQFNQAHDAYRNAYALTRSPEALVDLGQSDFQSHNYPECAKIFEAINRASPAFMKQNPPLYYVMGQCYANTNQKDKARTAYRALLADIGPTAPGADRVKKLINDLNHSSNAKPSNGAKPQH